MVPRSPRRLRSLRPQRVAEASAAPAPGTIPTTCRWAISPNGKGGSEPTPLSPNEQYSYVSLWCLLTAPLIFSGDITRLDDFTLGLLTNDEVIEVDQDPLGKAALRVSKQGPLEVWAKDMEDGTKAVGLFNRGEREAAVTANWGDLGLAGRQIVRDLWRQKDLGTFEDRFSATWAGTAWCCSVSARHGTRPTRSGR